MADYVPIVLNDDETVTYTASGSGSGGDVVFLSGAATAANPNGTVAQTTGPLASVVGVAAYDYTAGQQVTVYSGGIQELVSGAAITAGGTVCSGASGRVIPLGANTVDTMVGVALSTVAGAALPVRVRWTR